MKTGYRIAVSQSAEDDLLEGDLASVVAVLDTRQDPKSIRARFT